jgi:hypothetical protein
VLGPSRVIGFGGAPSGRLLVDPCSLVICTVAPHSWPPAAPDPTDLASVGESDLWLAERHRRACSPSPTKRLTGSRTRVTVGEGRGEGKMAARLCPKICSFFSCSTFSARGRPRFPFADRPNPVQVVYTQWARTIQSPRAGRSADFDRRYRV